MRVLWNQGWSFLRMEVGTELADALSREQDFVPVDIPHDWLICDPKRFYENGDELSEYKTIYIKFEIIG